MQQTERKTFRIVKQEVQRSDQRGKSTAKEILDDDGDDSNLPIEG